MTSPKYIVYIDMDDVLFDFTGAHSKALIQNPKISYPQSQYGFYANLEPLPYAIESVLELIQSDHFDPYILTAPSIYNPLCYTEKRVVVEKYFGIEFVKKLIISPNKGLLKGNYLIDDKCEGRGQEEFEGRLIEFGSLDFPNWHSVLVYLKSIL